jgi:SHS2 domain-containing protein
MSDAPFEVLEHTADIGFEVRGATLPELYVNAARALLAIAADTASLRPVEERRITVRGADRADLLVNWLGEILYLFDSDQFVPAGIEVASLSEHELKAVLRGEPRDVHRHRWKLIVKGVTYHQLAVAEIDGGWWARVILDI